MAREEWRAFARRRMVESNGAITLGVQRTNTFSFHTNPQSVGLSKTGCKPEAILEQEIAFQ